MLPAKYNFSLGFFRFLLLKKKKKRKKRGKQIILSIVNRSEFSNSCIACSISMQSIRQSPKKYIQKRETCTRREYLISLHSRTVCVELKQTCA